MRTILGRVARWGGRLGLAALIVGSVGAVSGSRAQAQTGSGHIVVIVLENQKYSRIVGNSDTAPYLNSLIAQGELFSNYRAVTSGSLRDYLAMTSGLTSALTPPSANIFQAIDSTAGAATWTSFQESMPGNCGPKGSALVPGTATSLYTRSHDPAYHYRLNESCNENDVPMTAATFVPAGLPSFSFVVPNECDDMHTLPAEEQACPAYFGPNTGRTAIEMGDNWLARVVPQLLAQPDVTVLITWDEAVKRNEQVATLAVGAGVTPGSTDATAYDHYGLLAGLYAAMGLGTPPNNAATATPLPIP